MCGDVRQELGGSTEAPGLGGTLGPDLARRGGGRGGQALGVVRAEGLPDVLVVDEGVHIHVTGQLGRLQDRDVLLQGGDQLGLDRRVEGGDAVCAVVEVDDLGGQGGGLRDLLGGGDGVVVQIVRGLGLGLEEGLQDSGALLGEVLAGGDTVEGGEVELGSVVQGLRLALVGEQTRPGDELRQRVRAARRQGRSAHRGLLVELLDALVGIDVGALEGPYEGAVGGGADARRDLPALEVGQGGELRAGGGDDGVQTAAEVVAGDRDQAGGLAELPAAGRVDEEREVAHRADVDLPCGHLGGDRGAGGVVLPVDLVGLAVVQRVQLLLEVAEGAQQGADGDRVDGLGLVADGDGDRGVVARPGAAAAAGQGEQKDGGKDGNWFVSHGSSGPLTGADRAC